MSEYEEMYKNAGESIGHVNIVLAGKTGVGESTLINAVFQEDLAETGVGRPVTQHSKEYTKEGFPVSIIDTKGLELVGAATATALTKAMGEAFKEALRNKKKEQ